MQEAMISKAKALLADGTVTRVIGWKRACRRRQGPREHARRNGRMCAPVCRPQTLRYSGP